MPAACALPESSMRVFLTGATGVIGRRVLPLLVGLDHSVTAVVHRPQSRGEIERAGAVPVQVDLFARAAIQRAVAGHDAVINLSTHLPAGLRMLLPGAWAENDRIRRIASANLVDAAIAGGATRFIQEIVRPGLSRPRRGMDRRANADRARAIHPLGGRCRTIGAAVL